MRYLPRVVGVMVCSVMSAAVATTAAAAPAQGAAAAGSTFTVGTAKATRGQTAYGAIEVPAGSDAALSIPVAVVHGARPGPVLAIVSGAHGTEYASIIAVERLIQRLDAKTVAGTVILVPLVNVPSFEQKVPHVNPVDGKSMNRFYPGKPDGTQTERASFLMTKEVVEKCDHLIDLHGGDLDESLRPYSYWTKTGNEKLDAESRELVLAFGLDTIIISADRPKDPAASRYLENTATTRGKASMTAEAGHAGTVEPEDVDALVNGSLSVMRHLKMIDGAPRPIQSPVWIEKIAAVTSEVNGIFTPLVKRGTYVSQGMLIGYVSDYLGRPLAEARAPESGVVLYICAVPTMTKGATIANIGVVGRGPDAHAAAAGAAAGAAEVLVVVEQGAGRVTVLDAASGAQRGTVKIGTDPHEVAISPDGRLAYVSNFGLSDKDRAIGVPGDSVSVVDLATFTELRRLSTLPHKAPHGVKVRPGRPDELFVNAEVGDVMLVFSAASGALLRQFPVPKETHNFIFSLDGRTLFLMAATNGVLRVDPDSGAIQARYPSTSPIRGLTWTSIGAQLLASGRNELLFLDPATLAVTRRITDLGVGLILYSTMTADGTRIFAPCPLDQKVLVVDVASGKAIASLETGKDPIAVLMAPDHRSAYVSNASDDHLSRIDLQTLDVRPFGAANMPNGLTFMRASVQR
jgi:predicted deacylase/DNA-binding beta-propeller fold protein YncE